VAIRADGTQIEACRTAFAVYVEKRTLFFAGVLGEDNGNDGAAVRRRVEGCRANELRAGRQRRQRKEIKCRGFVRMLELHRTVVVGKEERDGLVRRDDSLGHIAVRERRETVDVCKGWQREILAVDKWCARIGVGNHLGFARVAAVGVPGAHEPSSLSVSVSGSLATKKSVLT
jgi:hypothetical protein